MKDARSGETANPTLTHWLRTNLRAKFAFGLALPLLLILGSLSIVDFVRARRNLDRQMRLTAQQLGDLTLRALRQGMLEDDRSLVANTLADVVELEQVSSAQIVNLGGEAALSVPSNSSGSGQTPADITCALCHQVPASQRPRTIQLERAEGLMRVASPIRNDPECRTCHQADPSHLGVLLLDVSLSELRGNLRRDLQADLMLSGGGAILVTLAAYALSNSLVVRRLERFRQSLSRFSRSDFSARIDEQNRESDEVGELARAFNEMAQTLERGQRAEEARTHVRQRAILQERDRIARELHDGVAQVLGYVNTKAVAARLKLRDKDPQGAEELLRQLESASKEVFTDVRAAILGLKASNSAGLVFPENLRQYVARFRQLSGLPVSVHLGRAPLPNAVPAETELQLLRITQEALANSHKHSQATAAEVSLQFEQEALVLRVADNGVGFDPADQKSNGRPQFGLTTMRERAEAIGGEIAIETRPGHGTVVLVRAPLARRDQ